MSCPYCAATRTTELRRRTTLSYRMFRCRTCRQTFNERTNTPFNHLQVPTDVAVLVVLWRLQYKLSLRNVAEMFLTPGFTFTHETAPAKVRLFSVGPDHYPRPFNHDLLTFAQKLIRIIRC